jgi:hypothetical protein
MTAGNVVAPPAPHRSTKVVAAPTALNLKTPRAVAVELEKLAAASGNAAFARAARALFQQTSTGRPAINDRRAIEEAVALFREGNARSMNAAFRQVAAAVHGFSNVRSVAERLRQKWKARKI